MKNRNDLIEEDLLRENIRKIITKIQTKREEKELNEEEVRQEYYSKLNHLSQMDQPPPRITTL